MREMQNWIMLRDKILSFDSNSVGIIVFENESLRNINVNYYSDWYSILRQTTQLPWLAKLDFASLSNKDISLKLLHFNSTLNDSGIFSSESYNLEQHILSFVFDYVEGLNLPNCWIPMHERRATLDSVQYSEHIITLKEIQEIIVRMEKYRFLKKIEFSY